MTLSDLSQLKIETLSGVDYRRDGYTCGVGREKVDRTWEKTLVCNAKKYHTMILF